MPVMTSCPNCQQSLRVADAQIGRSVRCPACRAVFSAGIDRSGTPAVPQAGADDPRAIARARTSLPGLGLILNGLLTALVYGGLGALILCASAGWIHLPKPLEQGLAQLEARHWPGIDRVPEENQSVAKVIVLLVLAAIGVGIGMAIVRAGARMRRLRGRWSAIFWSCVSLLPITTCLWGLPFGLWALIVLFNPAVKPTFDT